MNELEIVRDKPISPIMPIMQNLIANSMPASVKPMDVNGSMVGNYFHNVKLGQLVKAATYETEMSELSARKVKANTEAIFNIVTLSTKIEDQFDQYRHAKDMRVVELDMSKQLLIAQQLANMNSQLSVNILQDRSKEEIEQIRLKNEVLRGEVKLSNVELEIKMMQIEQFKGGK